MDVRCRIGLYNVVLQPFVYSLVCLIILFDMSFFIFIFIFQESLKYRLLGSEGDIGSWGHEYVR